MSCRPVAVGDQSELSHSEGDQVIGANDASSMLWLTQRVTRHAIAVTMPEGYSREAMPAGLVEGLDRIASHLAQSINFDQGSEWAK